MTEAFDPTPYIAAERARRSTVATACDGGCYGGAGQGRAEIRQFPATAKVSEPSVAAVAAVAAPQSDDLPWSAALARFLVMPCPDGRNPTRWAALQADCEGFSRTWGRIAVALGWSTRYAFGYPRDPSSRRVDQLGLVPLLDGRPIAALTDTCATILNSSGAPNVYRLYPWRRPGAPLWVAFGMEGGP